LGRAVARAAPSVEPLRARTFKAKDSLKQPFDDGMSYKHWSLDRRPPRSSRARVVSW
jgi:hypothetical protein